MFRCFDPDGPLGTASFGHDPISRLKSLANDLAGTASDLSRTFDHNPASQIVTATSSNDAYSFDKANVSEAGTYNGLNQVTQYAGGTAAYDARGNMTADPVTGKTASYWRTNDQLWVSSPPWASHSYDALDRLMSINNGGNVTKYAYDGVSPIAEYDGAGDLQRRYVFDPVSGQPLVWYEGTGTGASVRRYLSADERGSIISVSDSSGDALAINAYDEYGIPNFGALADQRFGYAGMLWLDRAGLHQPTLRAYGQHLGRFNQADPIGYLSGPNLYAYVGNDPVNWIDPLGLDKLCTGSRLCGAGHAVGSLTNLPGLGAYSKGFTASFCPASSEEEIVVCGSAPSSFDFGNPLMTTPAVRLPGPFAGNPDPNVVCGPDCMVEVTIFGRRKGSTPWMLTSEGFVRDPDFVNLAPYLDLCLTPICGAVGGAGLALLTPEAAWFFGPAGPAFGHPAFGAASRGAFNVGRTPIRARVGFGRFQRGIAQFRIGVMSWKQDLFGLQPPKGGGW